MRVELYYLFPPVVPHSVNYSKPVQKPVARVAEEMMHELHSNVTVLIKQPWLRKGQSDTWGEGHMLHNAQKTRTLFVFCSPVLGSLPRYRVHRKDVLIERHIRCGRSLEFRKHVRHCT